ncbi:MAG: TonB-dependent receptor domain-containing protein [Pseudomonadota bacterium]
MMNAIRPKKRFNLRTAQHALLITTLASPAILMAQEGEEIEEVVVTGSYIRNSAFAQNSPVDNVSQEDLYESGSPSMAQYIRDLTYTQNTNVVNNILASSSGDQSSTGTTFNLRGLGENSTLTLVDGVRSVDNSITALLPDIAVNRMEVVLDGGSALYGSDAVAGVVNLIPIKEFDGLRMRSYYQRPEEGGMEEGNLSALVGKSFNNGVNWVAALEARKRTRLDQFERPREWMMDDGSSSSGNPGTFRQIDNGQLNLRGSHGGTAVGSVMLDPSCGTFNEGLEDRTMKGNTPSGVPIGSVCQYNYTNTYLYSRGMTEYNMYQNVTYEMTDWLQLEFSGNWNYLADEGNQGVVTALNANNRSALLIPASHPANPYGVDVSPWNWRPSTGLGNTPHWINDLGNTFGDQDTSSHRLKFGARFDISPTWTGYAYYSRQERKVFDRNPRNMLYLDRLQLALQGMGGPSGDLYFNPFGSVDPRSPYYEAGITENSDEVLDWMWEDGVTTTTSRDYLNIGELTVTGEVIDVPAGAIAMATGIQWRDVEERDYANPLSAQGNNYNSSIDSPPPRDTRYFSEVRAAFLEVEVPILDTLALQGAVRHEEFTDFDLESTTPKVALRWEALDSLAVRASWGESFLAPTPTQARPFIPNENCGEVFSGNDPFRDASMIGAFRCSSGNPNLQPETSEIVNVGFTWEPANDLSISMDYQSVDYVDRIRTLSDTDTVFAQFDQFLDQSGRTRAGYDSTPGSADRQAAEAYLRSIAGTSGNPVVRNPDTLAVDTIYSQAQNISSIWIDLLDMKANYRVTLDDWGTFGLNLSTSFYLNYDYADLNGEIVKALNMQNAETGIAPPLPKIKSSLRMNWFRDLHSASVTANYRHHVEFDGRIIDRYGDGWADTVDKWIDSETIVNAQYAYQLTDFMDSQFTISGGVNNLFDRRPERLPIQGGFESRLSVPWGRQFWVSVDWEPDFL